MNPADLLKQARGSGYGSGPKSEGETGIRSFPMTPEECEAVAEGPAIAHGEHRDGKFHVHSIETEQGASNEDAIMVKTPTQVSPS